MKSNRKISAIIFITVSLIGGSCASSSENVNSSASNAGASPPFVERPQEGLSNLSPSATNVNALPNESVGAVKNVNGMLIPANAKVEVIKPKPGKSELLERPAPFDSVVSIEMNGDGDVIERRTFKQHPSISKVEKLTKSATEFRYRVYLRNGKVLDLNRDAMENPLTASPDDILKASGLSETKPKTTAGDAKKVPSAGTTKDDTTKKNE